MTSPTKEQAFECLEDMLSPGWVLMQALKLNGYPVSEAAWAGALYGANLSREALALHNAALAFGDAIKDAQAAVKASAAPQQAASAAATNKEAPRP